MAIMTRVSEEISLHPKVIGDFNSDMQYREELAYLEKMVGPKILLTLLNHPKIDDKSSKPMLMALSRHIRRGPMKQRMAIGATTIGMILDHPRTNLSSSPHIFDVAHNWGLQQTYETLKLKRIGVDALRPFAAAMARYDFKKVNRIANMRLVDEHNSVELGTLLTNRRLPEVEWLLNHKHTKKGTVSSIISSALKDYEGTRKLMSNKKINRANRINVFGAAANLTKPEIVDKALGYGIVDTRNTDFALELAAEKRGLGILKRFSNNLTKKEFNNLRSIRRKRGMKKAIRQGYSLIKKKRARTPKPRRK